MELGRDERERRDRNFLCFTSILLLLFRRALCRVLLGKSGPASLFSGGRERERRIYYQELENEPKLAGLCGVAEYT